MPKRIKLAIGKQRAVYSPHRERRQLCFLLLQFVRSSILVLLLLCYLVLRKEENCDDVECILWMCLYIYIIFFLERKNRSEAGVKT